MHVLEMSISNSRFFENQRDLADFLGIKNSSKKAIHSRCKAYGYGIEFDDYAGGYNIKMF